MNIDDIEDLIERAFKEDLPDITTDAIFEKDERGAAKFLVKGEGVIAGLTMARAVFAMLDENSSFRVLIEDGSRVRPGDVVAEVEASVRALLSGERTALNLVQRCSGIATATRRYVDAVAGTKAQIVDTRKTAPGLRTADKYGVVAGGGKNHRIGLFDMFLIKNNHVDRAGSITKAVERIRATGRNEPLMIEVRDMEELREAISVGPDYILLDNMSLEQLREAVALVGGRIPLEASGGITLGSVRSVAETGVDRISIGALTHSVQALDISLRMKI